MEEANRSAREQDPSASSPVEEVPASASADVRKENGFSAPVAAPESAPAPASPARPKSAAGSVVDVTVVDADVLDCGVCFLPLKPPIFQVLYTTAATNSSQTKIR
jgi:E3 ubiquitin-protein ligase SIAH1